MVIYHKDDNASGTTLLKVLYCILQTTHATAKPFCLSLQVAYKIGVIGTIPVSWAETRLGVVTTFAQVNITTEVRFAEMHFETLSVALLGNNMVFNVMNMSIKDIYCDNMASDSKNDLLWKQLASLLR